MRALLRGDGMRGNLAFALAAQASSALVNVFLSLLVAKRLSVEDFSYWQLFTFYASFAGLAALGVGHGVLLRYAGQTPRQWNAPLLGGQFRALAAYALLFGAGAAGLAGLFVRGESRRTVLLAVAVYLVLVSAAGFWDGLFQASGQTRLYSAGVLLARLLFLLLCAGLLAAGAERFQPFLACFLFAQAAGLAFCLVAGRRVAAARGAHPRHVWTELARNSRAGLPLLLSALLGGLLLGSGRLVVERVYGIVVFGRFSFALALVNLLGQFVGQAGMVLFPALKKAGEEALPPVCRIIDLALDFFLPLPLLAYVPLRALLALWLPRYTQSLAWLALLLPLCLFDGKMQILYATCLKIHRREKTLLAVNAAGLAAALALSLLAAGLGLGVEGVALGLVAASALRGKLACQHTAGLVGLSARFDPAHLLLAAVFIAANRFLPPLYGFLVYLGACIVFWLAERHRLFDLITLWRQALWTG